MPNEGSHREIWIPDEVSSVRLAEDWFDPSETRHGIAAHRITGEIIETAQYRGENDFLVVQWRRGPNAPDLVRRPLEAMLSDWADTPLIVREAESVQDGAGEVALAAFEVLDWQAECLGFREDRDGILFGVYCRDDRSPLTLEQGEDILAAVRVRDIGPPPRKPVPPDMPPPPAQVACRDCPGDA